MPSRLILQEWWTSVGPLVTPATITHVNISDNLPNGLHLEVNEAIELGAGDTKVASGCADITLSAGESHFAHIDRQLGNLHADALCHRPAILRQLFGIVRHACLPRYPLVWVASVRR
jgi:hypothetical protein